MGAGLRLGTTGVEVDPRLISLGSNAGVRFAGAAQFPRQIPVQEGEKLLDWRVDRLGALHARELHMCRSIFNYAHIFE